MSDNGILFNGAIQITGEHDTGKTTFALECGTHPSRICLFDDDVKGRSTIENMMRDGITFGRYIDMVKMTKKMPEYNHHLRMREEIDGIQPGEFDAIVFDTWTKFSQTCHSYVLKNPGEFKSAWSPNGKIKSGEQWKAARELEASIINDLTQKATMIVLVTHLKAQYINNIMVPNKEIPASSNALERVPVCRIWLRHNPSGRPIPIGLVLKRLNKKYMNNGRLRTINVLPRKIVPQEDEHSLWDSIEKYWNNPFGDKEPSSEETPDEFELSILDGTLTIDQRKVFNDLIKSGIAESDDYIEDTSIEVDNEQVLSLNGAGLSAVQIAAQMGIPLPMVLTAIKGEK